VQQVRLIILKTFTVPHKLPPSEVQIGSLTAVFTDFGLSLIFCQDILKTEKFLYKNSANGYGSMSQLNRFVMLFKLAAAWLRGQRSRIIAFLGAAILAWGLLPAVAFARAETPTPTSESIQPYLDKVIERVSEFRLDNGIKFIVLERHRAPVVSFLTYADVGGVDEPNGKTGVAHFLEHLAFKGTTRIGTKTTRQKSRC
jgi:hypothetical protein